MLLMSSGPVNQKQSMCMGRYKKIPGFSVEYKPVWKHEQHSRYLCSVDNQWMVSDCFKEDSCLEVLQPYIIYKSSFIPLQCVLKQVTDTPGVPGDNRIKHGSKSATSTRPDDVPKGKWMFYGDNKWITDADLNVYSSYD